MDVEWFKTVKIEDNLYLTKEPYYTESNVCNIWLLKGPSKDVIIDTGLGVRNLREHLENQSLIGERECLVICTHVHFDHTGGAHHFPNDKVLIHKDDMTGLQNASQLETLNFVKPQHFLCKPYPEFSSYNYRVPPTRCQPLEDQQTVDIGDGKSLKIIHVPGHTKGNIIISYPKKGYLFSGDFAYQCKHGTQLLDFFPHSSIPQYIQSCRKVLDWLQNEDVYNVYPGHFEIINKERLEQLLMEYIDGKADDMIGRCTTGCCSCLICCWVGCGCFRCCPCM